MPRIKHVFSQGKMNKDLDERLVPNGEYREAMNIEVSTSEDDGVGAVRSLQGNHSLQGKIVIKYIKVINQRVLAP